SEEHTSELQSLTNLVCRLLLEKKKTHSKGMVLKTRPGQEMTSGMSRGGADTGLAACWECGEEVDSVSERVQRIPTDGVVRSSSICSASAFSSPIRCLLPFAHASPATFPISSSPHCDHYRLPASAYTTQPFRLLLYFSFFFFF